MAKYCPYCASQIEANPCPYCNHHGTYRPQPHHLKPGTLLHNKYLVGVVLGEGGFGITYVGRDLALDMKVAIKEYFPSGMAMRNNSTTTMLSLVQRSVAEDYMKGERRFITEAQTMAKLDKEGAVVTVRDFFEENNSAYIVMEFVEGKDLRKILQEQQKPMDAKILLPMIEPVFSALGELHKLGLLHRDISPDNIMLENGKIRLIDFGCAMTTRQNTSAAAVLKHCFSPIEQYSNNGMGPWSDVYAMGATLYYCLSGKLPPKATDRLQQDNLPTLSSLGVKLRPKQEKAILKALSLNPKERYPSMADFGKDLFIKKQDYRLIAIGACALAAVAVAGVLIFGPDTRVEVMEKERTVANHYTLSDSISDAEKKRIRAVTDLLENNAEMIYEDSHYNLYVTNQTDTDFDEIYFHVRFLDAQSTVLGTNSGDVTHWKQNENAKCQIYHNGATPAQIQLSALFQVGDNWYQTEYITKDFAGNQALTIEVVNQLPQKLTFHGYSEDATYTISAIDVEISGYRSVEIRVSGQLETSAASYPYLDYRLLTESGAVAESGTLSLPSLKIGERFEQARISFYSLKDGHYTFELLDHNR